MTEEKKYSIHRLEMMLTDLKEQRGGLPEGKKSNPGNWIFLAGLVVAIFVHLAIGIILCIVGVVVYFSNKQPQVSELQIAKLDSKIKALKEEIIVMKETSMEYIDYLPDEFDEPKPGP